MRAVRPNTKSTTKTSNHTVHFASPEEHRTNVSGDTREADSDVVFQGLQNRHRDLLSPSLAKNNTAFGSVPTLLFRLFLHFSEATVQLNPTDGELGQPPADVVFHGLQICQRDPVSP